MTGPAFFGRPASSLVEGGAHVAVYLVPVWQGSLVVFDVEAPQARGRWLPWTVLEFGQNPYESASLLADDWCPGPLDDLRLVDVLSFPVAGGGWELAIVFRAELATEPKGDEKREPYVFPSGRYDAIGNFDPVDLERWVGTPALPAPEAEPEPSPSGPPTNDDIDKDAGTAPGLIF